MAVETIDLATITANTKISIEDLRNTIRELKKELEGYDVVVDGTKEHVKGLEIGSEEYKKTLEQLQNTQAALKNAMHGTATDMEQIAKAARGQDESYNGLVRTMAKYKEELRAIDTSTEEGMQAFKKKAAQINDVNDKLKKLDAMQGNYQRNVGNYKSAVEGLGTAFKTMGGSAALCINPVESLIVGFKTLSATPVLAVLGLLAAAFNAVAKGIQSSEENTNAWNRALAAFKPIGDAFMRSVQEVAKHVTNLANSFADLLIQWGLLDEEAARHRQNMESNSQYIRQLSRQILVSNAQLEAEVAEAREKAAEKDKYNAKQRIEFLELAQDRQRKINANNLKLAQAQYDQALAESKILENDADANDRLAEAMANLERVRTAAANSNRTIERQIQGIRRESTKTTEKKVKVEREEMEMLPKVVAGMQAQAVGMETAQQMMDESVIKHTENRMEQNRREYEQEQALNKARIAAAFQYADAVASVFGSVADMYEANGEADEESAKKAKQLRTAEAVISTISGAIAAYMNTIESIKIPAIAIPLAVVNAAAVTAAGMAQVKKIQSTKVGSGGDSSSVSAITAAPSYAPAIAQVHSVTNRSETERLNRMASDSRVYLVYSDLEIANTRQRVRVQETEF